MREVCGILAIFFLATCSPPQKQGEYETTSQSFKGKVNWIRVYGGSGDDTAQAIVPTNDGGYAILGSTTSTDGDISDKDNEASDYWLVKVNQEGALLWSRTYGGSLEDIGQALVETRDGGFALAGYAMSSDGDATVNQGFHDNWIVKVNAIGELEWEKSFGFSGHDHVYDIVEADNADLFYAGFMDLSAARNDSITAKGSGLTRHGVGEFWGVRMTKDGDLVWWNYYGGTNNDRAYSVVSDGNSGFVLSGFSESTDYDISFPKGSYDFWAINIGPDGNLLWEHSFGGTGIDISHDIARTRNGGYLIAGQSYSFDLDVTANQGDSDCWIIQLDYLGSLQWEYSFGGSSFDAVEAIIATSDGGAFFVGNSKSSDGDASKNAGENDIWAVKLDESGNMVWQQSLGGLGRDMGFDVLETPTGEILLVGETESSDFEGVFNKGKKDLVIVSIE